MKQSAKQDPALVVLAHWQRIEDKINRSKSENVAGRMLKQSRVVEGRLEKTVPTTLEGIIGMLNWIESQALIGLVDVDTIPAIIKGLKKINQRAAK
jgi:hypothetical protein